jgi:hypothetical protein
MIFESFRRFSVVSPSHLIKPLRLISLSVCLFVSFSRLIDRYRELIIACLSSKHRKFGGAAAHCVKEKNRRAMPEEVSE